MDVMGAKCKGGPVSRCTAERGLEPQVELDSQTANSLPEGRWEHATKELWKSIMRCSPIRGDHEREMKRMSMDFGNEQYMSSSSHRKVEGNDNGPSLHDRRRFREASHLFPNDAPVHRRDPMV